jgi:hypothetical protein
MRQMILRPYGRALVFICILVTALLSPYTSMHPAAHPVDKIKAEDVLAKHLESIGPAEERSSEHSRVVVGGSRMIFNVLSRIGTIEGRVILGSVNRKVLFATSLPAPDYPGDKFGYDGKKLTVGFLKPGRRSTLEGFILIHEMIFKEGLFGGTLSSAWPLLNLAERKAKLEYAGTEKIGTQLAHKVRYSPNKGSDLEVTLYFDTETFRHVRTQYDRVVGARLSGGGIDNQTSQRATRYKMIEDFSDYRQEGKLNLPHSYKLELYIDSSTGTSTHKWEMNFTDFTFNQEIDEKGFNVEAN